MWLVFIYILSHICIYTHLSPFYIDIYAPIFLLLSTNGKEIWEQWEIEVARILEQENEAQSSGLCSMQFGLRLSSLLFTGHSKAHILHHISKSYLHCCLLPWKVFGQSSRREIGERTCHWVSLQSQIMSSCSGTLATDSTFINTTSRQAHKGPSGHCCIVND